MGALGERLEDQPQLHILKIAEPPVDQFRAPRRRPPREVLRLHQGNLETPARRVARGSCPGDPAADHQEIELLLTKLFQRLRPRLMRELCHLISHSRLFLFNSIRKEGSWCSKPSHPWNGSFMGVSPRIQPIDCCTPVT